MMDQEDKELLLRTAVFVVGGVFGVLGLAATAGIAVSVFRLLGGL